MADSDDEYDRKRRDKFRGERSAGGENLRSERRDDRARGRDDWQDRGRSKPEYRDYRGGGRDRGYSPGREMPSMKRMRGEWDDGRPRYGHEPFGSGGVGAVGGYGWGGHEHYPIHSAHAFNHPVTPPIHSREQPINTDLQTQPCMMTLKQFLATQDDSISDSDAIQKYNDYKLEFKRQQLNEFFVAHKDEEWFKIKYHPEESMKRKQEQLNFLKRRVEVFVELLNRSAISKVSVDTMQTDQLLYLLDTVVIKLEGGTEEDLKILDEKPLEIKPIEHKIDAKVETKIPENKNGSADVELTSIEIKSDGDKTEIEIEEKSQPVDGQDETLNERKRKRSHSGSASLSSSSSESENENENEEIENDENIQEPEADNNKHDDLEQVVNDDKIDDIEIKIDNKQKDDSLELPKEEDNAIKIDENVKAEDEEKKTDDTTDITTETIDLDKVKDPKETIEEGPRALHKTSSIFLRNLAPTITKAEVEAMCKRYSGFLRIAIADPLVERRWFRRGWVTFKRDVNIKEICWNFNNIRLRDCELGAIVNRDLSRRVRPVNGVTSHKTIIRSDIKLCAKIAHNLDEKSDLWKDDKTSLDSSNGSENRSQSFGLKSKNPVLQNITDYLIEEASAEEEELLGLSNENKDGTDGELIERDPSLISVLDKLILYLRIVHSVDFYNHCEYPYEDEMPNRCGIIHARAPAPQNKVTSVEVQDYIRNFESKMSSFLSKNIPIEEQELKKLGSKDPEAEMEKFIAANTQELAKDKWLCPLSGKKFKGPEFIRKHILNKHSEKIYEVRKEVEYFNNYLKDIKRPQLPEHPGNLKKQGPEIVHQQPGYRPPYPGPGYGPPPYAAYAPPMVTAPRPRGGFNHRRQNMSHFRPPATDYRPIIHYRDLDAPREPDEFI